MEPREHDEDYHNWPRHLKSDPIEFIAVNGFDFVEGCILKYVSRYKYKDGLRDLYKARAYLDRLIAREEEKGKVEQGSASPTEP